MQNNKKQQLPLALILELQRNLLIRKGLQSPLRASRQIVVFVVFERFWSWRAPPP
jgi:hypothetical protein